MISCEYNYLSIFIASSTKFWWLFRLMYWLYVLMFLIITINYRQSTSLMTFLMDTEYLSQRRPRFFFHFTVVNVSEIVFTVIATCNQQCHRFPRRVHPVRKSFSSNYALADNNARTVSGRAITSQPTPLFFLHVHRPLDGRTHRRIPGTC